MEPWKAISIRDANPRSMSSFFMLSSAVSIPVLFFFVREW
jgi:hypothetical protein